MSDYLSELPKPLRSEVGRLFNDFYTTRQPVISGSRILGIFTSTVIDPLAAAIEQIGNSRAASTRGHVSTR